MRYRVYASRGMYGNRTGQKRPLRNVFEYGAFPHFTYSYDGTIKVFVIYLLQHAMTKLP